MSEGVTWFDSHCHLQEAYLPEGDDAGVVGALIRAAEAGVAGLVCVGTDADTSAQAVALARAMAAPDSPAARLGVGVWATIGLHPHDAKAGVATLDALLDEAADDAVVVGIGECGLDYYYEHSDRQVQRDAFAAQVALAHERDLALVIHTRDAWDDTIAVLTEVGVPERTIIHCFTGGPTEARRCLELGAALSFSGVVTFKNAGELREAAALCPLDRLLVETDSPFLTPVPHRGTPNEPSRVPLVGAAVAAARGLAPEVVAEAATATTRALFRL